MPTVWAHLHGQATPEEEELSVTLPEPIAEYFAAANTGDVDRVAACFAEHAVVRDEGREIRGRDAILDWAAEVRRKYHFHAEILAIEEAADRQIVTAYLTGDFPGNPIQLGYRFRLAGCEIVSLEIG
jgi:ketosteroid isomerase-like protein